jgi:hypothetical protein
VDAVIRIDDGSCWFSAHAAGTEQVHAGFLFLNRKIPNFLRARGIEKLEGAGIEPIRER